MSCIADILAKLCDSSSWRRPLKAAELHEKLNSRKENLEEGKTRIGFDLDFYKEVVSRDLFGE